MKFSELVLHLCELLLMSLLWLMSLLPSSSLMMVMSRLPVPLRMKSELSFSILPMRPAILAMSQNLRRTSMQSTGRVRVEPRSCRAETNIILEIRSAILRGDIDKALKLTTTYYPTVLKVNENIYFKLRCRKFIEMIRRCTDLKSTTSLSKPMMHASNGHHTSAIADSDSDSDSDSHMDVDRPYQAANATPAESTSSLVGPGRTDSDKMDTSIPDDAGAKYAQLLAETIQYGQELKQEFSGDPRREVKKALEDTFALIAYQDARETSLAPLLEIEGRIPVAEELNAAILGKQSTAF
jgi:hypothetical protein